ncbi:hypothetical protein ACIOKD_14180 [Streptomyces sp. NPDC087844]|uniref:hypothetical protein n=1 Tax=Streptomyces sp. NPDC087844 TaxID=3365805 RepID=UPI00381CFFCC
MTTPPDERPPVEPFPSTPLLPVATAVDVPPPSGETPPEDSPPPETEEPPIA